jgi:phosphatidylserine decarboxylase
MAEGIGWRVPLSPLGWREVLVYGGGLALLAAALAPLSLCAALPPALLAAAAFWFFRDPDRRAPDEPGAVVAPADGLVTHVEELAEADVWAGPAVKVSIYLSLADVHVNRVPESARVLELRHRPGRHRRTWDPASARDNEQVWTLLEGTAPPYPRLLVKQVAGPLVSRVVNTARPGAVLARGQRLGLIAFGSRAELYLSPHPSLHVLARPGDRVRAGVSVVARYAQQPLSPLEERR